MKVLLIGETCFDTFIYGKCERICPEAPIPIFLPIHEKVTKGMAANVLENLKSLDKKYNNKIIFDFCTNKQVNKKIRYVDEQSNQMILRVDEELIYSFEDNELDCDIQDYDAVIISDYNKGLLSESQLIEISSKAKLSFIDTKKKYNYEWAKYFNFIKINNKEANENGFLNIKEIFDKMIVTAASDGCYFKDKHFPIKNKSEVRDVCGAGDTFLAAFAYSIILGQNVESAIDFAQDSCQTVISKRGVVSV
jgi:D-beta-D-heptose 7-phosphate kinase/D-beta-D-heptose 1-phosphate adenosyltransferase